jgi:hypothetical protein
MFTEESKYFGVYFDEWYVFNTLQKSRLKNHLHSFQFCAILHCVSVALAAI